MAVNRKPPSKKFRREAQEINRLHSEREAHVEQARTKATRVGTLLIEVKDGLPHGQFLEWLRKNCPEITERTARQYMAFVRGDVETLMRGGTKQNGASADTPHPLTENQERAIELVKNGKSYRQVGEELGMDESSVRRDPMIRKAREEVDPEAHSKIVHETVAGCYTISVDERIRSIKGDLETVLGEMYDLNERDQRRIQKILEKGLEALKNYGQ